MRYFVSDRERLELACCKLTAANAPQLPLWRADRRIALSHITGPEAALSSSTLKRWPRPVVALVGADMGADDDAPPDQWQCAKQLKYWTRFAFIHAAGGRHEHYRAAVIAAEKCSRVCSDRNHGRASAGLERADWLPANAADPSAGGRFKDNRPVEVDR
jgi:hypothetical protein